MAVREAQAGDRLTPGTVLIAPGDHHLVIRRDDRGHYAALDLGPPENSCRPSVDVLFRSAAEAFGGSCLAVVLTGMGVDGLRGAEQLHALGARVVAQDQASSVVWGMPGAVAGAGLADAVVPLKSVAHEIQARVAARTFPSTPLLASERR
jgi:two-component system chemotaxis response regulator CheB